MSENVLQRGVRNAIAYPRVVYRLLFFVLVVSLLVTFGFPLYWLLVLAVTPPSAVHGLGLVPESVSVSNFAVVALYSPFLRHLFNGLLVATLSTVVVLVVGSLAGYAFGRLEFPGRRPLLLGFLVVAYFPPASFLAPLFHLFTGVEVAVGPVTLSSPTLYNTPGAVVLPTTMLTLPLAIYVLTTFYAQIPDELEAAARVEGTTRLGAFRRVVLPLARPGIAAAGVLTFVQVYNEFFFSYLMTDGDPRHWAPLAPFVYGLRYSEAVFGAAAAVLGLAPIVVVVLVANDYLVEGLAATVPVGK
ncbi:carbohydrate ABC transporter permease [Halogeometricum limi]|uniref:Carbohydrate ABC transporter membrane protein 2, CUT1 family (TC 3.A.1.1.-) n=1 Tax=Halogeometricum limi TaxID=555875 RepID=A0A1I6FUC2_9EURY|nr:carbohydrate ABC transporter permease [Halogeometricum limi]SFR33518.1 carbohydrate ABC transporter membrane protein 2, CUT1 family (TC 3.A.1.1.-) [Halogeometricum limi]